MKTEQQINELGPWISKFVIDGIDTCGWFDVLADGRVNQWLDTLNGRALTVLECGSLEGGHTALIARHPQVKRVVGLEGRMANLKKCRFVHEAFGISNSEFALCDLDTESFAKHGKFDAIFCSGLLYHLMRPDIFLNRLDSPDIFLGTHYALTPEATFEGMQGCWYQEQGLADVLSGLSAKSFWLTLDNICQLLVARDYHIIDLQTIVSQNGPWVNLIASKGK